VAALCPTAGAISLRSMAPAPTSGYVLRSIASLKSQHPSLSHTGAPAKEHGKDSCLPSYTRYVSAEAAQVVDLEYALRATRDFRDY
jgi:hypothetical protein